MPIVVDIDADPAPLNSLVLPSKDFYDAMVAAHNSASQVVAYDTEQRKAWVEAGKPMSLVGGKRRVAEGFEFVPPLQVREIEQYLRELLSLIEYVGMSVNDYIEVSYSDYSKYATTRYRLGDA